MAEKIGLEATLEDKEFIAGVANFMQSLGDMGDKSDDTADKSTGAFSLIDGAVLALGEKLVDLAISGFNFLKDQVGSFFDEAVEGEESLAKLDAMITATGGAAGVTSQQAQELANAMQNTTRFSDDAVLAAEAVALRFTNIGKDVFPKVISLSGDLATVMGTDITSAAQMLGKALEVPGEGLSRLKTAGVTFTDQEEAMIKKMVKAGDVAGAQAVILGKLEDTVGGAADMMGQTFAGKMEIFNNKINNAKEAVGNAFLPVLTDVIDKLQTPVTGFLNSIADLAGGDYAKGLFGIGDSIKSLLKNFGVAGPVADQVSAKVILFINNAKNMFTDLWANLQPIFSQLVTWLSTNIPIAIQFLSTLWTGTLQPAINTFITFLTTTVIPFLLQVWTWIQTNLPTALQFLSDRWNELTTALTTAWTGTLQPALQDLWNWLQGNLPAALATLSDFWTNILQPALQAVWTFILTSLIPMLAEVYAWIYTNIPPAIQALADFWTTVLQPALQIVWQWMQDNLFPAMQVLFDWISTNLPPALQTLADFWTNTLQPAMQNAWQWIQDNLFPLFQALGELVGVTVPLAMVGLVTFWTDIMQPALQAMWDFVSSSLAPIFESLSGAIDGVSDAINWVVQQINDLVAVLGDIELPDWMTPGSPTPWEIGLIGISGAMGDVSKQVDKFGNIAGGLTDLSMTASPTSPYSAMSTTTINNNPAVNMGGVVINNGMDLASLQQIIIQTVTGAMQPA